MKIEQLKPGQVVYSVLIVEIDPEYKFVTASWNGNRPQKFFPRTVSKWRKEKPVLVSMGMSGMKRLATREELKEMKAKSE
jgi:hypothetical protein